MTITSDNFRQTVANADIPFSEQTTEMHTQSHPTQHPLHSQHVAKYKCYNHRKLGHHHTGSGGRHTHHTSTAESHVDTGYCISLEKTQVQINIYCISYIVCNSKFSDGLFTSNAATAQWATTVGHSKEHLKKIVNTIMLDVATWTGCQLVCITLVTGSVSDNAHGTVWRTLVYT